MLFKAHGALQEPTAQASRGNSKLEWSTRILYDRGSHRCRCHMHDDCYRELRSGVTGVLVSYVRGPSLAEPLSLGVPPTVRAR